MIFEIFHLNWCFLRIGLCTLSKNKLFSCHLIDGAMTINVDGNLEVAIENFFNITRSLLNDDSIPQYLGDLRKIHYMKPLSASIVEGDSKSLQKISILTIVISVCAVAVIFLALSVWYYISHPTEKRAAETDGQLGIASRNNFESIWVEGSSHSSFDSFDLSTVFPTLLESRSRSSSSCCSTISDLSAPLEKIAEEGITTT